MPGSLQFFCGLSNKHWKRLVYWTEGYSCRLGFIYCKTVRLDGLLHLACFPSQYPLPRHVLTEDPDSLKPALHTTLWVELKRYDLKEICPFRTFLGFEQRIPKMKRNYQRYHAFSRFFPRTKIGYSNLVSVGLSMVPKTCMRASGVHHYLLGYTQLYPQSPSQRHFFLDLRQPLSKVHSSVHSRDGSMLVRGHWLAPKKYNKSC